MAGVYNDCKNTDLINFGLESWCDIYYSTYVGYYAIGGILTILTAFFSIILILKTLKTSITLQLIVIFLILTFAYNFAFATQSAASVRIYNLTVGEMAFNLIPQNVYRFKSMAIAEAVILFIIILPCLLVLTMIWLVIYVDFAKL